ncbi:MAG TPA: PKD-like domain-containing protein, partial [Chitinophagaceae bacterium]
MRNQTFTLTGSSRLVSLPASPAAVVYHCRSAAQRILACLLFFVLFSVVLPDTASASHVVGGALTYVHNGGSSYTITLKLYRDCHGVTLGNTADINLLGYDGVAVSPSTVTLRRISFQELDPQLDSCAIEPNPLPCVEEHIYTATVNLPPLAGGYHLYYQVYARNQSVTNVNTSCNCIGESFKAYIPGTTEVWWEDFTLPNGTTSDAGVTAWTRTLGASTPDYAQVVSNLFEIRGDGNDQATWTSQVIDISAYPAGVSVSVNLSEPTNTDKEADDSMLVYYSLDGGPFTLFPVNGIATDDFSSQVASATGLTGSTLQVMIVTRYGPSSSNEIYRFDDVVVVEGTNSNPVFSLFPPLFLCADQPFVFDHSATDADGDSLAYSFYTPYNGYTSGGTAIAPTVTGTNASFTTVVYQPGYSSTNPLGGTPLTLNPATGMLSGTPSTNGQFLVGIKVSEYRNGVLLSEMLRDFQFNVVTCQPPAEALITPSGTLTSCNTSTVTFPNNSNSSASNFWWDFGDGSTTADTSSQQYPTYTYPAPGTYTVMLVTNKGLACADTSTAVLSVGSVAAAFTAPASACINTAVNFTDASTTSANTTITSRLWDFGDGNTSNQQNPAHTYTSAGNYTVSLTVTNSIGCDSTITRSVTIDPQPAVNAGVDTAICSTSTGLQLNGSFSNAAGVSWTGGTGTFNPGSTTANAVYTPSAAEVSAGTVTLTLTTTGNGACNAAVDTKVITITAAITVDAGADQVICKGTAASLNGTVTGGTTTGNWTSSGTGSFMPNSNTLNAGYLPSAADEAAGGVTLYLTSTNNVGCAAKTDSLRVSFFDYPVVNAGSDLFVCAGTSAALSGSVTGTSTTGLWSTTGSGTFSPAATALNAVYQPSAADIAAGNVVLRLTATNSCSPVPFDELNLTIYPTPSVTTANSLSICSATNPSIALTATLPGTFSWTVGTVTGGITGASAGSGATINQILTNPGNSAAGTVEYIVTTTSNTGSCTSAPYPITVTVNPTPVVTTASTAVICNNTATNIALTASTASTFTWTIGTITGGITGAASGSGATIAQTLTNPGNSTAGTVQYIVTPTSTATPGCSGEAYAITVTVNPTPQVNTSATASVCSGTATNIALTATTASTFTWTVGTITGGITGASAGSGATIAQTLTNPGNSAAGTVQYLVTPTSTATPACPGAAYPITVTVNPTPVVTTAATAAVCSGENPSIGLTASAASTFTWTVGTITGGITGASAGSGATINQNLTNPGNSTAGTVQYIVTPTSTATPACAGTPSAITVTVNPKPVLTSGRTAAICSGTATSIALTATAASTYTWTVGTITGGITGATAGSGSTIAQTLTNPGNAVAGTVDYIVTPTSTATPGCAGAPDTITVTVNPRPAVTNANTAAICNGSTTNITLTATAPSTFTWTVGTITGSITGASAGSGSTIAQTLTNPSNATAGTVQYIVTPTSTASTTCPGTPYTITITVNPTPAVT